MRRGLFGCWMLGMYVRLAIRVREMVWKDEAVVDLPSPQETENSDRASEALGCHLGRREYTTSYHI